MTTRVDPRHRAANPETMADDEFRRELARAERAVGKLEDRAVALGLEGTLECVNDAADALRDARQVYEGSATPTVSRWIQAAVDAARGRTRGRG